MKSRALTLVGIVALFAMAGCSPDGAPTVSAGSPSALISPLAGKWSGKSEVKGGDLQKLLNSAAGGPLTGPSTLTLSAGGTGFLKVADKPERPISWKQEGKKILVETRAISSDAGSQPGGQWVGTVSEDNRTMTIDMEDVKVVLSKVS
jgi:hypothetical protein